MSTESSTSNDLAGLFRSQPALRQLLLLVGLAASIAVGVGGAMWLRSPGYISLQGSFGNSDPAEVIPVLQSEGITYKLDPQTGSVMVRASQADAARESLFGAGVPTSTGGGFESFFADSPISTSQFKENANLIYALQNELANMISSLRPVQSARVIIAAPSNTSFIGRTRNKPRASVTVHLHPNRSLDAGQVASIVQLVSGSFPELEPSQVSVVDQNLRLLSDTGAADELSQSERQLDYRQRVQADYEAQIEGILAPLLGPEHFRATVAADIDFTMQEESSEQYDPNGSVVRSEQIQENRNSGSTATTGGIPGALSNQAPQTGEAAAAAVDGQAPTPTTETVQQTRNLENSRTLSVTRRATGTIERISVAVVVNEEALAGDADEGAASGDLLQRVEQLARQAIGFNEARGDSMTVTSAAFMQPAPPPDIEEASFLSSPGFRSIVMQSLSIIVLLVVGWGVARPIVRMLTTSSGSLVPAGPGMLPAAAGAGGTEGASTRQIAQLTYTDKVAAAKQLVGHDAERVAEIVKGWVNRDG